MTRAVVLAIGAIGLAIVLRAAAFYRGSDRLAFFLVLLIGAGLVVGLVELVRRLHRTDALVTELAGLPRPATEEAIEASSPELRGLLRARLGGVVALPAPALFTPYLVGFLVLLGLLGTFLGLFETLRGATQALALTNDVDSLRQGLAAPMVGLTRAFGTSACGVAASGTLGFAAVFVRRDDQRFGAALASYVALALQPLTVAARTLAALRELAAQGNALPRAADALSALVERVERGEKGAREAHEASAKQIEQSLGASMRELLGAVREQATATTAALEASTQKAYGAVVDGARELHAAVREQATATTAALETSTQKAHSALVDGARDLHAAQEASAKRVEQSLDASMRELVGAVREQATATTAVLEASTQKAQTALVDGARMANEALVASTRELHAAVREQAIATTAALEASTHKAQTALVDGARVANEALVASTRELHIAVREEAAATNAAIVATSNDAARERAATTERIDAALSQLVQTLEADTTRRGAELSAGVLAAAEAVRAALTGAVDGSLGELRIAAQQVAGSFVARIDGAAAQMTEAVTASATRGADALAQALEGRVASDEARAERLESKVDDGLAKVAARAEESLASFASTLSSATEASGASATRFREGVEGVLARLETTEASALARIEEHRGRVASVIAEEATRLRTLSEEQLAAQTALLERATSELARRAEDAEQRAFMAHRAAVDELVSRATAQQVALGTKLDDAAKAANEATDLAKGAGIELAAVAEMFTAAVDRYREANDAWQLTLKRMEERLENELRADAAVALEAHLQRTREVFQESLEFQRELFAELRTLRGRGWPGASVAHGEAE